MHRIVAGWLLVWSLTIVPVLAASHELSHDFDAGDEAHCELCAIAGHSTGAALPSTESGIAIVGRPAPSRRFRTISITRVTPVPAARGPPAILP